MQQLNEVREVAKQEGFTQTAVALLSGLPASHLSMWFREIDEPTPTLRDRVLLTVRAMARIQKRAGVPIDWSRPHLLRAQIEEEITELRKERSKALRAEFESRDKPIVTDESDNDALNVAELLGTEDGCNC
jgi:transcriptional regulator with XRE-family HTH domain